MRKVKVDSKHLERLLDILAKECEFFVNFLKVSREKTEFILKRKTEELQSLTKEEENWVSNLKKLEENREDCIQQIGYSLGLQNELKISTLIPLLGGNEAQKLSEVQDELNNLIEELKNINEINGNLLKNSLEYIDFMLNIVSNASDVSDNSYGSGGKLAGNSETRRMMDFKL
jgi:flagellar biosynthesis/type III secretory pathway chaperone